MGDGSFTRSARIANSFAVTECSESSIRASLARLGRTSTRSGRNSRCKWNRVIRAGSECVRIAGGLRFRQFRFEHRNDIIAPAVELQKPALYSLCDPADSLSVRTLCSRLGSLVVALVLKRSSPFHQIRARSPLTY